MMQITPTVKQLLIINILFFIGSQVVGEASYNYLSLFFFENNKILSYFYAHFHSNFIDICHYIT